ncbi:apoptotic protease-activating factor 1-like [Stegodyphus dumicola]|uniref:apoptotic protease-activating factor 1-like n=1 Tax=Stegodyphus dumicola TaxID=202533 RepID=UPI0015A97CF3|nr:apoptotic protease-activating factor 1-like [Stegodyphus dumicola]
MHFYFEVELFLSLQWMKVLERYRLHRDKQAFLDDLRPKYILASLTIRKVITHQESKEIKSQVGISKQVEKLFEILPKKSSECFNSFIEVLEEEDETGASYYPWLAEHLRHKNDNLKKNVYDQLINGGIPFPVNYVLHREKKLEDVRQFLIEASKLKRHWIVLYGMPGTGKSVLAAEAIRDNDIVENYFPGGVYWLQIGNLRNDDNALWLKMKKLFTLLRIEKELCPSESLSELTELLKREINDRNQTLLLILDDVWSNTVIKAFDIGCPILVTTKDKTIMQKLSQFCSPMELRNDLLLQEGRDLLSMYVKCEPSQLPKTVNNIFSKTKGSPSILSLIGSMMEDYGNDFNRWEDLNKKLENGIRQAFHLKHGSGDVLNDIKDFLYLMLNSIQHLKEYFKDLIIFCEDVYIPNKLLEIYWGKDPFEVEDIMFELYKKSLVQMQTNAPEAFSYCVTDIYIEILLEDSSPETIKTCHKKLVNNYLELCRQADGEYNFTKLPHDDYIHYYLGYHMFNAEEYELLEKVYLDLGFVEQKLKLTDPRDLLADYQHYRKCFRNEDELIRFESFVERNFNKICNNENTQELLANDIVQLALFEPSDSIVYKKAKKLVGQLKDKVCFEWCNKGMDGSHFQNLRTRSIAEILKHAIFSFDNTLIASVGESSKIQIWSTSSHEEIQSFTGHSGSVNSCAFNSDGSKLASASDDGTVKIFKVAAEFSPDIALARKRNSLPAIYSETVKVDIDMSIFTFDEHSAEVLCCAYSPDDSLIISSDSKGCVISTSASATDICGHSSLGILVLNIQEHLQFWYYCDKNEPSKIAYKHSTDGC